MNKIKHRDQLDRIAAELVNPLKYDEEVVCALHEREVGMRSNWETLNFLTERMGTISEVIGLPPTLYYLMDHSYRDIRLAEAAIDSAVKELALAVLVNGLGI